MIMIQKMTALRESPTMMEGEIFFEFWLARMLKMIIPIMEKVRRVRRTTSNIFFELSF